MAGPIVLCGGGTGGHIFPMKSVASALRAAGVAESDLRYVGSRRGQERQLLGNDSISLVRLPGRGFQRSWSPRAILRNIGALGGLAAAVVASAFLRLWWRPRAVVSVGGYAAWAFCTVASRSGVPLVTVDLDAVPSATNRSLAARASVRCVAFAQGGPREVVTGTPIDEYFEALDRSDAARGPIREAFVPPLSSGRVTVVVMSGSLGARSVNDAVTDLARRWANRADLTLIHVAGRRDAARVRAAAPPSSLLEYRVVDFADMRELWALADLAVCRAGALTVAEVVAVGVPAVLVPLPGAPGDHQTKNAQRLVDVGGAHMLSDRDCTGEALAELLEGMTSQEVRTTMQSRLASLHHPGAARHIALEIQKVSS